MPKSEFRVRGDVPVDVRSLLVATDRVSSVFVLAHAAAGRKLGTVLASVTRKGLESTVTAGSFHQVGSVAAFVPADSLQSDIAQGLAGFLLATISGAEIVVALAALPQENHKGTDNTGLRVLISSSEAISTPLIPAPTLEEGNIISSLSAALLIESELKSRKALVAIALTESQYLTSSNASLWTPLEARLGLSTAEFGLGIREEEAQVYSNHLYL